MADAKSNMEFTALERAYVKKALQSFRVTVVRMRSKELVGSEIHTLRGKEFDELSKLIERF